MTSPAGPLRGENIVCFAKDWTGDPTSVTHVMRTLARDNKVLWLNSISSRTPNLGSGKDLKKIFTKLAGFAQGAREVEPNLWVYTPIVLPLHGSRAAVELNQRILRVSLTLLRKKLGMPRFQCWTFVPTTDQYVGTLGEELLVYYCTDDWSQFSFADPDDMNRRMERLARAADVVFATSSLLVEKLRPFNAETHLASHGVAYRQFAAALDESTVVPPDLASVPRPVVGYFGLIEDWLDLDLLHRLASGHPEWSFAFIGSEKVNVDRLRALPNVHFLGRKPHTELPAYCKGFDVGLIPHRVIDLTRNMNPIKLREYLSAGVPVVSTALPEVRAYADWCAVADSHEEFERAVAETLKGAGNVAARQERSRAMEGETWDAKVSQLGATVMAVQERKRGR